MEHERLEALIGRWRTEGWTSETAEAPAARIEAVDTYEWLPGSLRVAAYGRRPGGRGAGRGR
jgi:hypothetical protein